MFQSPTIVNKIGFVPIINQDDLNATGDGSPELRQQFSSPLMKKDEGGMIDMNEISAINNTTMQDTS